MLLAERLLEDRKYDAAIAEFQVIVEKEPFSSLGKSALLKIAQIQHIYLGRAKDAKFSYEQLLKRTNDEKLKLEIEKSLASLAYDNLEEYWDAIEIYKKLLGKNPSEVEAQQFTFNIARSYFFLNKFDDAVSIFESIIQKYPTTNFAKKSELELGYVLSARGKCKEAIKQFEKTAALKDPEITPLALFAAANCYEEMDSLEKAYDAYNSIRKSYPAPAVVEMKMTKLKRRKILRKR